MKGMFMYSTFNYSHFTAKSFGQKVVGYTKHVPSVCRDTK